MWLGNAKIGRRKTLLVALGAGVAVGGIGLLLDALGVFNCDSWIESCTTQWVIFWIVLVIPWLSATIYLAARESITALACFALALSISLALASWTVASAEWNLDHDYVGNDDISEAKVFAIMFVVLGVLVVTVATAVVGLLLQALIAKRRKADVAATN